MLGYPARYSLSPALHNAAYAAMDIDASYLVLPVESDQLGVAISAIRAFDMLGVSVTIPHKEAVAKMLDELSPAAQQLDAVNCVVNRDGYLIGHNTDGEGFVRALREELGFDLTNRRCAVFGAGGAARSVISALGIGGAGEVIVINRSKDRADQAARFAGSAGRVGIESDVVDVDLVVNATPIGMEGHELADQVPFDLSLLNDQSCVADLIYHPLQTQLLRRASDLGIVNMNGVSMLVYQAALQIELWTGRRAPIDVMKAVVA